MKKLSLLMVVITLCISTLWVISTSAQKEEQHPSLGKDAPAFKLDLLDGGNFDLSAVKGKKIIVLDFWATWCPPCRKALPILAEVTASYADKDVVFYAVNLQEEKDKITDFLAKEKIKCLVALDKDATVAKLYNVDGIPQSVIIGKDGVVQVVHVGLLPDLKEQLKKELDDLVAGKSLIGKDATITKKPAEEKKEK